MATPFYKIGLGLVILLALAGCQKDPPYMNEPIPFINYEGYQQRTLTDDFGNRYDSLTISIGYQDGDGDLGLSSATGHPDMGPPYQFLNPNGTRNPNYYNFIIDTFLKRNGVYEPFPFPTPGFTYSGRFMRLSQDDRVEPLEGTLRYSLPPWYQSTISRPGTVVKFRIYIKDRALNNSNVVETDDIVLFTGQ
ncbi:hypothetical protein BH24BAC1_BH24BAC1_03760 [soil metagenome]